MPAPGPNPGALRILLVDDDELIRLTCTSLLQSLGHGVVLASASGEEALAEAAGGLPISLAILDFHLPGRNGLEILSELRQGRPGLAAILITGSLEWPEPVAAGLTVLVKPFSLQDFQSAVERVLAD